MTTDGRLCVLCVDDEPRVVEGLALNLRRRYEVETACSGADGLAVLARRDDVALVISDMRMPGMNGAAFLQQVRERAPDTVRILLTGQADMDAAIAAVNDGQIFRFLTKPCPPPALLSAVDAAAQQHALIVAERELLEQTLHGCIKALCDVLAVTSPRAFGRATRIKRLVADLAARLAVPERWQIEVAAMLCQLGWVALPDETVAKVHDARPLTTDEEKMIARVPVVSVELIASIPRLDGVRAILTAYGRPYRPPHPTDDARVIALGLAAAVLRAAADFDDLVAQGNSVAIAVATLRGRVGRHDVKVLDALEHVAGGGDGAPDVREVTAAGLKAGMILVADVKMSNGALLVTRGTEVTAGLIERLHNFRHGAVAEPIRVALPRSKPEKRA